MVPYGRVFVASLALMVAPLSGKLRLLRACRSPCIKYQVQDLEVQVQDPVEDQVQDPVEDQVQDPVEVQD